MAKTSGEQVLDSYAVGQLVTEGGRTAIAFSPETNIRAKKVAFCSSVDVLTDVLYRMARDAECSAMLGVRCGGGGVVHVASKSGCFTFEAEFDTLGLDGILQVDAVLAAIAALGAWQSLRVCAPLPEPEGTRILSGGVPHGDV